METDVRKKKYFSKLVDCYLVKWISIDSWHTKHVRDMERFYKFICALKQYSRSQNSAKEIENKIKEAVIDRHNNFNKRDLDQIAKDFSIIAMHCLNCLRTWIDPLQDINSYRDKFMKNIKRNE